MVRMKHQVEVSILCRQFHFNIRNSHKSEACCIWGTERPSIEHPIELIHISRFVNIYLHSKESWFEERSKPTLSLIWLEWTWSMGNLLGHLRDSATYIREGFTYWMEISRKCRFVEFQQRPPVPILPFMVYNSLIVCTLIELSERN